MLKKLKEFLQSFQGCLSFDNNGKQVEIELEILDKKSNILCHIKGNNLTYISNTEIINIKG